MENGPENDHHHKDVQQRSDGFLVFSGRLQVGGQVEESHRQAGKQEGVVRRGTKYIFYAKNGTGIESDGCKYQRRNKDGQRDAGQGHVLGLRGFDLVGVGQNGLPTHEDSHANEHANTGRGKGVAPAVLVAQPCCNKVASKGTDVDAHVEDVVALVFEGTVFRLVVEVAQQRRNIRFERPVAQDDQQKTHVKGRFTGNGQGEVPCGHQQTARNDGFSVTKDSIGQEPPNERGQIHQCNVGAVHVVRRRIGPSQASLEAVGHIEEENSDDQVKSEAFPHLGEKQGVKSLGMLFCGVLAHAFEV